MKTKVTKISLKTRIPNDFGKETFSTDPCKVKLEEYKQDMMKIKEDELIRAFDNYNYFICDRLKINSEDLKNEIKKHIYMIRQNEDNQIRNFPYDLNYWIMVGEKMPKLNIAHYILTLIAYYHVNKLPVVFRDFITNIDNIKCAPINVLPYSTKHAIASIMNGIADRYHCQDENEWNKFYKLSQDTGRQLNDTIEQSKENTQVIFEPIKSRITLKKDKVNNENTLIPTKVTEEYIYDLLAKSKITVDTVCEKVTIVTCELPNGFIIVESSGAISKENYSQEIGYETCMKHIVNKLWMLEGYLLANKLYEKRLENE